MRDPSYWSRLDGSWGGGPHSDHFTSPLTNPSPINLHSGWEQCLNRIMGRVNTAPSFSDMVVASIIDYDFWWLYSCSDASFILLLFLKLMQGMLWEFVFVVVLVEGRRSHVDLVTHKSDQSRKLYLAAGFTGISSLTFYWTVHCAPTLPTDPLLHSHAH